MSRVLYIKSAKTNFTLNGVEESRLFFISKPVVHLRGGNQGKEKPRPVKTEWGLVPVRQSKACQHIMNCLSGKGMPHFDIASVEAIDLLSLCGKVIRR